MISALRNRLQTPLRRYSTIAINEETTNVVRVSINRPQKHNAMNRLFFQEIGNFFSDINNNSKVRAIILTAEGKNFSSGLDLEDFKDLLISKKDANVDMIQNAKNIANVVASLQKSFLNIIRCNVPVIAAIQGACIGGGFDLALAADIRLCERDTSFCVKEVDLGICPDMGTIQLLPTAVGSSSLARELIFTARTVSSTEAESCGLVSKSYSDVYELHMAATEMAKLIATKSPVAVQGPKIHLNYSRDHSVEESLEYQSVWSGTTLQSHDVASAALAHMTKTKPKFNDY